MKQYPFPETKFTKPLLVVYLTALLYICRDSMFTTALLGFNKAYLLTVVLTLTVGIGFLVYNRNHWNEILKDTRVYLLLGATLAMIAPMVCKGDWQIMYLSVLFCLYVGIFFSFFMDYRETAKYYVLILTVVGCYSVVATYLLRILPDRDIFHVPVFYNSIGHMFHNFGISIVSDEYVKMRNFGIFREPGVYQYFVLLALFLNNYTVVWKKERTMWIVNVVLAIVMLSTLATGGIVELAMLAVTVFFHKKLYKSKKAWILLGIAAAVFALFMAFVVVQKGELYWTIYGSFVSKFAPGADSSSDRVNAILKDLGFFLSNPLFGGVLAEVFDAVPNNTTSTMLMLAIFGLPGGIFHVVSWCVLVWDRERTVFSNLFLLLILFMAFNTQNLIADVFLWLLPMMALCQKGIPWLTHRLTKE
jgi:hypothetical protein